MAAVTQHRPSDALAGRRYGSFAGKPAFSGSTHPVDVLTQHRPDAAIGGKRYGSFAGRAGVSIPTITSVTAVSGTELAVAWTGTATEYRLNGGTATALPDGTSPDTISGLTDNTYYLVELRDGAGAWSTGVGEWTDNTGGGGGSLNEVNPSSGALRFTGYAPTIARTTNQWVAPTTGAFRFTGYAPTIERTGSIEVIPQSGALRFTGYMPVVVVSAGGNQTIEPASGALRFTGYAPTVENVGVSFTSAGVLYVPIRMVSSLWSAGNVGGAAGEVAWLPPARQPMVYTDTRTGQMFCDPAWYRFFEYIAETRLAGKTGPTLTSVVQTLTDTQTTAAAATVTVTELQQQTQANAEALYVTREVVKYGGLPGAEQIPFVEL